MSGPQFAKVPRWLTSSQVSASSHRVYAYLAWRASPATECDPTVYAIGHGSADPALSDRTVFRALADLEAAGAIQRFARPGHRTVYRVFTSPLNVIAITQPSLEIAVDNSAYP